MTEHDNPTPTFVRASKLYCVETSTRRKFACVAVALDRAEPQPADEIEGGSE